MTTTAKRMEMDRVEQGLVDAIGNEIFLYFG
jgi:hypothetical protein